MTGEEALQEIKLRKDALAKQAQSNLNANYNIYSDYLSKTAQNENKGALNSYQNYPAVEGTDSTRARSAYLNRLASANDAYAEGMRGLNLYRDKLGANMDAASLNADATINGLEYKNALYNDQMAYQRERDAVADAQWQKNFDLGYLSSTGTSGGGRSYGGYSGFGGGGDDPITVSPTEDPSSPFFSAASGGAIGYSTKKNYDYALSQIARGRKDGDLTEAEATALMADLGISPWTTSSKPVYEYALGSNGLQKSASSTTYGAIQQNIANKPAVKKSTASASSGGAGGASGAVAKQNKRVDMTK